MAISLKVNNIRTEQYANRHYIMQPLSATPLDPRIEKKWTYLLSNTLVFKQKTPYTIRLPKPCADKLYAWLVKIICAGQCKNLFVEQLTMPAKQQQNIADLAKLYGVNLIMLKFIPSSSNLIKGPWLQ